MPTSDGSSTEQEAPSQSGNPSQRQDSDSDPNSIYSASETSALDAREQSSSSQETRRPRGRPKKRTANDTSRSPRSYTKRLKGLYNDEYRQLFNETLEDVVSTDAATDSSLFPSQHGVTFWSSDEKQILFSSIARRGRHDIGRIAADLKTKSEPEVWTFMQEIQHAATEEQIYEMASRKLPKPYDIPAAFEIGDECCKDLDLAAEALSDLQYKEEARMEREEYSDFPLLTSRIGKWANLKMKAGEAGEEEVRCRLSPAILLDLKVFLALSKRFFMNSSVPENNWRSYTEQREYPSMMYSAFLDFHTLVLSITRRLVQSSLLLAMSRLRALDASGQYDSRRYVRQGDVSAALNILGLEPDGRKTWIGAARKCRLRVYENVRHLQASGIKYGYDDVEEILRTEQARPRGRSGSRHRATCNASSSPPAANPSDTSLEKTDVSDYSVSSSTDDDKSSSNDDSSNGNSNNSSNDSSIDGYSTSGQADKQARKRELLEKSRDTYADILDQHASRDEERRLWDLLGEDPDAKMEGKNQPLPKAPGAERKDRDDLVDWSTRLNYAAEWEQYETPVPANSFIANRRRKRKGSRAGLTDSNIGSDKLEDEAPSRQTSTRRRPDLDENVEREPQNNGSMSVSNDDDDDDGLSTRSFRYKGTEDAIEDPDTVMDQSGSEEEPDP